MLAATILATALAVCSIAIPTSQAATLAHWCFEEGSGSISADCSGNGNTAFLLSGAGFATDVPPMCQTNFSLRLAAPGDAVRVDDVPALRPAQSLTIEAWIKPDPGAWVVIGKQLGAGCCSNSYQIELRGGGPLNFILSDPSGGQHFAQSNISVPSGEWHHVAATWDGTLMLLYLDNQVIASNPFAGPIGYDGNPVLIGADDDGNGVPGCCFFTGGIDEVRMSDVALLPPDFLKACPPTTVLGSSWGRLKVIYR